jgi:DcuC family C4-dicarboxylate transporter
VGGNLFNPGEPDIVAITTNTGLQVSGVMQQVFLPNLLAFAVAVAVLILLSPKAGEHHEDLSEPRPLNLVKALLGPLPVVLLLILQPALGLAPYLIQRYPGGVQVSLVMLVCTVLVMLVSAGSWKGLLPTMSAITHEFFEGMGYAFANVISVIIAASCFIAGLNAVGLISAMSGMLAGNAMLAAVLAPALTWVMAVVGGSGTAPTVAFSKSMLPGIAAQDPAEAVRLGVAGAIGANVGRTMSPVAAVVLFTSTLTEVSIPDLWKRVAPCMLAAVGATIILGLFLRPS